MSEIDPLFKPKRQPITADSKKEPQLFTAGADSPVVPPRFLSTIFAEDLVRLAIEDPEVAFRIYLSDHATIENDGSVVFEDDETALPIKINKPKNKHG